MPPLNASFDVLDWEQVVVSKMGVALNKTGRQIWCAFSVYFIIVFTSIKLFVSCGNDVDKRAQAGAGCAHQSRHH
jgi:hypothetical protein